MNKYSRFIDVEVFKRMEKIERRRKMMTFFKKELPCLILFGCIIGAILYM